MQVKCPNCTQQVQWSVASPHRPFCSKRCQLIDLGEWVDEEKRIKGDPVSEDSLQNTGFNQNKTIYFD